MISWPAEIGCLVLELPFVWPILIVVAAVGIAGYALKQAWAMPQGKRAHRKGRSRGGAKRKGPHTSDIRRPPVSTTEAIADAINVDPQSMPLVPFGGEMISRLACGANTIFGGSHLSTFVNQQMRAYFTNEQIMAMFARCEECGVNLFQSGGGSIDLRDQYQATGGTLHYLSLCSDSPHDSHTPQMIADGGALGVAHHGEVTDTMFKEGRLDEAREFCKRARDTGIQVGVSTHMPAVIHEIEEQDWDIDFYMACVYERHRSREELLELLGHVPIPVREVYLESDPPRMYEAIQATDKTCFAFKILAAGRLSDSEGLVEGAFKQAFEGIKPTDAVIVGMYPEYSDQVGENAAFTVKHGS